MKKLTILTLIITGVFFSAFTILQTFQYQLKDDYVIKFKNTEVSGSFGKLQGSVIFDEANLDRSSFNMTVPVASIKTGNFLKNSHAKGSNWFDADHYPSIRFVSNKFAKSGSDYEVTGTLEIHGVQKQVVIPFTFVNNTFTGNLTINRLDYKVGDMQGMSAKVPADIKIELSIPVEKK